MNRTGKILTAGALLVGASTLSQCDGITEKDTKKNLVEVLGEEKKDSVEKDSTASFLVDQSAEKATDDIETSNGYFTVKVADLEGTPFYGKRRMIAPSYGNFLGFSQADDIMSNNNHKGKDFEATNWVDANETLNVPLIYPELKGYFPEDWDSLAKGAFSNYKDVKAKDLLIVTQCKNGKNALAYYKNGKLTLATYVSIGTRGRKTVTGEYDLTLDQIRRRSRRYHNSAMPYSISITGGYYLHQGWSNGNPQSHGCVRVPGLYVKWLYEHLPAGSKIILDGLYEPTI